MKDDEKETEKTTKRDQVSRKAAFQELLEQNIGLIRAGF